MILVIVGFGIFVGFIDKEINKKNIFQHYHNPHKQTRFYISKKICNFSLFFFKHKFIIALELMRFFFSMILAFKTPDTNRNKVLLDTKTYYSFSFTIALDKVSLREVFICWEYFLGRTQVPRYVHLQVNHFILAVYQKIFYML